MPIPPATTLEAQAALETAVTNALLKNLSLGLSSQNCKRMYDGQPPPSMGNFFVAVWGDNQRQSDSQRVRLGESLGVYLTLTVRFTQPFDRWVQHRDYLETQAAAIRATICQDSWNNAIINAANVLAGWRIASGGYQTAPVGFCESLIYEGMDAIQDVGPDWFHAKAANSEECGIAQRIKFGKARRVQYITTAT